MQTPDVAAILDSNFQNYGFFGVRIIDSSVAVGDVLGNSWHPADACEWVSEDTEIDGTCCFLLQHADKDSLRCALAFAGSYWPGDQTVALIAADSINRDAEIPEDGAAALRAPVVLAIWNQEI